MPLKGDIRGTATRKVPIFLGALQARESGILGASKLPAAQRVAKCVRIEFGTRQGRGLSRTRGSVPQEPPNAPPRGRASFSTVNLMRGLYLIFRSPERFAQLANEDAAQLPTPDPAQHFTQAARAVRRGLGQSFGLVIGTVVAGWVGGEALEHLVGPASPVVNHILQYGGVGVILWATLAIQVWNIQTIKGRSLPERLNGAIYRALYLVGSFLLVLSVAWPATDAVGTNAAVGAPLSASSAGQPGASSIVVDLLKYVGTPAVVVAACAWLLRALVQESLRRETDRLRASVERDSAVSLEKLRGEAERQLETLRHGFDLRLEEHKVRFARLQEKRVDLIVALYAGVSRVASAVSVASLLLRVYSDPKEWHELLDEVERACAEAEPASHAALLYLPTPIADRVFKMIRAAKDAGLYGNFAANEKDASAQKVVAAFTNELKMDFPIVFEELGRDLRSLLGVELDAPKVPAK